MDSQPPTDLMTGLAERCRQYGLKVTPQRLAILKWLVSEKSHPTADMVYQQVKKEFPGLSFDTVNRSLMTFASAGMVDIVEGQGGPRRFDPDTGTHHHFHCQKCGKIIDFHSPGFDALAIPEDIAKKFKVFKKRIVLNGICDACEEDDTVST